MTVTVSLVLLLAIGLGALFKGGHLRVGAAVIAVLFGFYLANTDAAPSVNKTVTSITDAITGIGN
ncbi:hypothetical protein HUT19_11530 [Streptomyces sp. NA02950]|uniref:hypothetical protein n=1 Tax=Streptomyces sp. NA02950 TaxID=2742137 RepID=UPI0015912F8D|nr:hypothetical protein [Streptomyces sp. NA02950]QKV92301.1 hypothetical protein HUT19_11530 [Streptomyces sp. NA02950]